MNYVGDLYGRIGRKYFPLGVSSVQYDELFDFKCKTDQSQNDKCKWESHRITNDCLNPHTKNWFYQEDIICCPTCGKTVEIVRPT